MAKLYENEGQATQQLWSQLEAVPTGLLWVPGSGQHPQPMSHFTDSDNGSLWFITSSDTDLFEAVGTGTEAAFTLQSVGNDYHASLKGMLVPFEDGTKLDEYWSFSAAAWFEMGRDDPKVRLLRFVPGEAAVWASEKNSVILGIKLMRAAMSGSGKMPDVSNHHVLDLRNAA